MEEHFSGQPKKGRSPADSIEKDQQSTPQSQPDFADYQFPEQNTPLFKPFWLRMLDIIALLILISMGTWFVLRCKRRWSIYILLFTGLIYLGFFRHGCICPIGAVCNISLALTHPDKVILGISTVLFFFIPLIFAFGFGRVFCGAVCPLGAVQEFMSFRAILLPRSLDRFLRIFKYIFLILAILSATLYMEFLVCRFDPFITLFRCSGSRNMWIFTVICLLISIFIARPYCRFFCPYGVLLGIFSKISFRNRQIETDLCTKCDLCRQSCPMNCIKPPHIDTFSCISCGKCLHICPQNAIK